MSKGYYFCGLCVWGKKSFFPNGTPQQKYIYIYIYISLITKNHIKYLSEKKVINESAPSRTDVESEKNNDGGTVQGLGGFPHDWR
jgi:hypothetical protein